ncbi:hypothetical protein P8C59_004119 [Phyllachora maydis]|uniref:Cytochrome P450 n=1 Tax=Phyllachora maydis TaxID=1825666 RepID=A0AAD9I1Y1_9PEZI|nr:hypothetical protein P8C59_004119 [Phyllachora maydis]
MAPLLKIIVASSAAAAYVLGSRQTTGSWPTVILAFVLNFLSLWSLQFAAWVLWRVILYPKVFSPLRGLPGPTGNALFMGQYSRIRAQPTGVPMADWINSIPNEGIIRYLGLFNAERILLTSPRALSEVLVTKSYDFTKPQQLRFALGRLLGVGVLLAEGDEHRTQRRNLMPAFAFRHIKDLYPTFWAKAGEMVQAMAQQIRLDAAKEAKEPAYTGSDGSEKPDFNKAGQVMEIGDWASRATLDIIGVAGLGQDFNSIANPDNELNQTYTKVMKPSPEAQRMALLTTLLPGWLVDRLPLKRNDDIHQAARLIRATCRNLIRAKKEKMAGGAQRTDHDILSVALESGGFSEDNLVDQLMTFLAAGHETTASSLTWAIYLLCCHPEVQARLRAEVRERLPSPSVATAKTGLDDAASISAIDIDQMPYLNAVCSEVLRYFSPVPMTFREAARDTTVLGVRVPRGTRVLLAPWAVNRSHALWGPDATRFNPDRWLTAPQRGEGEEGRAQGGGRGGATSNYAFLTFLHGPRSCIGASFAKAEFACLLAACVGRFEFELEDKELVDEVKLDIKTAITARPAKGLHVRTRVVEGW